MKKFSYESLYATLITTLLFVITSILIYFYAPSVIISVTDTILQRQALSPHYLIVAMPKSGSTFITDAMVNLLKIRRAQGGFDDSSEHDFRILPLWKNILSNPIPSVGQYHMRATKYNLGLINKHKMKVILLTRNFFDIIPSLHDHVFKEKYPNNLAALYLNKEELAELSKSERYDYLIDCALPWYLNFYAGWQHAIAFNNVDNILVIHYEDFNHDPISTLRLMAQFCGYNPTDQEIKAAFDQSFAKKDRVRYNQGITHRGLSELSPQQLQRIEKLVEHFKTYPWMDIEPLITYPVYEGIYPK